MYGGFFFQIEALLSLKIAWLPPISFLDTKSTCYFVLSPHSFKLHKNIPVLVAPPIGNPSISRCAERMRSNKVGTVLKVVYFFIHLHDV